MRSDSVKNMSAYADQNHAPSFTDVRLEFRKYRLVKTISARGGVLPRAVHVKRIIGLYSPHQLRRHRAV